MEYSTERGLKDTRPRSFRPGIALGGALLAGALIFSTGPALAAAAPVYRNIPTTLPGNVPSMAFEAESTSEFGDLVTLGAGSRDSGSLPVTVVMSSWACETGGMATCLTTPGSTWDQPITLNLYNVDISTTPPTLGTQITTVTSTFKIHYRPSPSPQCPASGFYPWYSAAEDHCYNGMAQPITFDLPAGITLPSTLVWSIAYNTQDHGYSPTGLSGPWNSLNVGAETFAGEPSVGTDVYPDAAWVNSTWPNAYTASEGSGDGGPTGIFRQTLGGWTGYAPLACFGACPVNLAASPTPTPTPTPTATPTPVESVGGVTATPTSAVGGATGTPRAATPPPTGTAESSGGATSQQLALFLFLAFGAMGLTAVCVQRRALRR